MQEPSSATSKSSKTTYSSMIISINPEEEEEEEEQEDYESNNISEENNSPKRSLIYQKIPNKQQQIQERTSQNQKVNREKQGKTSYENSDQMRFCNESLVLTRCVNEKSSYDLKKLDLSLYRNIAWKKSRNCSEDICDICNNSESQELDAIYICDLCHCTTHQSCYGNELLDRNAITDANDDWLCNRCTEIIKKNLPYDVIKCCFCPELKGSLKLCRDEKNNKLWIHLLCVNWMPDIYFLSEKKTEVKLKDLKKDRFDLICYLCGIKYGACIQCDFQNCHISFHVTCGQKNGLIPTYDQTKKYEKILKSVYFLEIYCRKHQANYPKELQVEMIQIQSNYLREKENFSFLYCPPNKAPVKRMKNYLLLSQGIKIQKKLAQKQNEDSEIIDLVEEDEENTGEIVHPLKRQSMILQDKIEKKIDNLRKEHNYEKKKLQERKSTQNKENFSLKLHKIAQNLKENESYSQIEDKFEKEKLKLNRSDKNFEKKNESLSHLKEKFVEKERIQKEKSKPERNENYFEKKHENFGQKEVNFFKADKFPKEKSKSDKNERNFEKRNEQPKKNFIEKEKIPKEKSKADKTDKKNEKFYPKESIFAKEDKVPKENFNKYAEDSDNLSLENALVLTKANKLERESENRLNRAQIQKKNYNKNNNDFFKKSSEESNDNEKTSPKEKKTNKLDKKILSQFKSLLKNSNIGQEKADEILKSLSIEKNERKRKASSNPTSEENFQINPKKKLKISNNSPKMNNSLSINKLSSSESSSIQEFIQNSIEMMKKSEIKPKRKGSKEGFEAKETKKDLTVIKESIEIERESSLDFNSPPKIDLLRDINEDSSDNKNFYQIPNPENKQENFVKKNENSLKTNGNEIKPDILKEIDEKKSNKITNIEKKINKIENDEKKTNQIPKNEEILMLLPVNKVLIKHAPDKEIRKNCLIQKENNEIISNNNDLLSKENINNSMINNNRLISQKNNNNDEEITYLETHKPPEKIDHIRKLKGMVQTSAMISLRNTKESYLLTCSQHIWGNVFSNVYKIEFETPKELVTKISEDFLFLKFCKE